MQTVDISRFLNQFAENSCVHSRSSQSSTTGVTKAVECAILSVGWCNIKEPLLLVGKSSSCGGSGFPLSLSVWSFTICPTPYNRKQNVLSAPLNKAFLYLLTKIIILSLCVTGLITLSDRLGSQFVFKID